MCWFINTQQKSPTCPQSHEEPSKAYRNQYMSFRTEGIDESPTRFNLRRYC